jgi:hypothetical protein
MLQELSNDIKNATIHWGLTPAIALWSFGSPPGLHLPKWEFALGVWVFTPSHSLALSCTPGSMWCDSRASSWLNSRASSCLSSRASFWLNSRASLWLNSRASLWLAPLQFPLPWSRVQARVATTWEFTWECEGSHL